MPEKTKKFIETPEFKEYIYSEEFRSYIQKESKRIYDELCWNYSLYLGSEKKLEDLIDFNGEVIIDYEEAETPGHGGRKKKDNKIHIYPRSYALAGMNINNIEDLKKIFIEDIIIHEMFHFFAQPDMYYDGSNLDLFGKGLTEGIVQYFTDEYIESHKLPPSLTGYKEEVLLVKKIIEDLERQNKTRGEIIGILFNCNQDEIIEKCTNGEFIRREYIAKKHLHDEITKRFKKMENFDNDKGLQEICRKCLLETNVEKLFFILVEKFGYIDEIGEIYNNYLFNMGYIDDISITSRKIK